MRRLRRRSPRLLHMENSSLEGVAARLFAITLLGRFLGHGLLRSQRIIECSELAGIISTRCIMLGFYISDRYLSSQKK